MFRDRSTIRSLRDLKAAKENIKTSNTKPLHTQLNTTVHSGRLQSSSPNMSKISQPATTTRKDFLKINRQNSGSRQKSLQNTKKVNQLTCTSNTLNPQSTIKQNKGRTVKDVRLQNTRMSSIKKNTERSKSTLKKSQDKSSSSKLKPPNRKVKVLKSVEVSMFSEVSNASAISCQQKKEDMSQVQYILRCIPSLIKQPTISAFQTICTLEEGPYYTEVLVQHSATRAIFNIRTIHKDKVADQDLQKQLIESIKLHLFLSNINIPHIQTLYTVFSDCCSVYLVMEPQHTSFETNLWNQATQHSGIAQDVLASHTRDLLSVLDIMHKKSILLRGLHLQHVKIQFGVMKLSLLDQLARLGKRKRRDSFVGKTQDISHQLAQGQSYGYSSDMWLVGSFIYSLATGSKPFGGFDSLSHIQDLEFDMPMHISKNLGNLITRTLTSEERRIGLQDAEKHTFIRSATRAVLSRELWTYWNDNFS